MGFDEESDRALRIGDGVIAVDGVKLGKRVISGTGQRYVSGTFTFY